MSFLSRFLTNPSTVGAIAPSSRYLAAEIVRWIEWENVGAVAEYGPGLGAFTRSILAAKRLDAKYLAVELEAEFVTQFRTAFPDTMIYQDSVENVRSLCEQEGISELNAIVSGLPWAAFSEELQDRLLEATVRVMAAGGQFVTFAYLQGLLLPAGQRFSRKISQYFGTVERSPIVWRNLPPAFVYRCRKD